MGHTIYATRFDTDDVAHRVCTFALMLAAVMRALRHVPEAQSITALYLTGFGIGTGLWAVSIFVPEPARYLLWTAGMAVDSATRRLGRRWRLLQRAPLDIAHLPERFALFTTTVLGETILAVVRSISKVQWQPPSVAAAVPAFGVAICIL